MYENLKWIAAAVAVVGLTVGGIIYLDLRSKRTTPVEKPVAAAPAQPALPEEPAVKHPLPEPETAEPLPPLDASDEPMKSALTEVIGKQFVEQFVNPKDLVRHIVVTIDNLPEQKVAERFRPVKPVPGTL